MTRASIAKRISPMLATDNMDATIRFYTDVLGFKATMTTATYSILERDGLTVHFQNAASEAVMTAMRNHGEFYLEVSGIDALWEHVKAFKDRYRIRDLFERDYGMTEFHIADPNGCRVFVGEPTCNRKGDKVTT